MNETSVFELISSLCDKLRDDGVRKHGKNASFRSCRAKAFQVILNSSGTSGILEDPLRELDFHLFEMKLKATIAFHRQHNEQLQKNLEAIEEDPHFRTETGKSILTFLLHLKSPNPPDVYKHYQDTYPFGLFSALQPASETNPYITVTEEMFHLPDTIPSLNISGEQRSNPYFASFTEELGRNIFTQNFLRAQETFAQSFDEFLKPKPRSIQLNDESHTEEKLPACVALENPSGLTVQRISHTKSSREIQSISLESFLYDLRALCMGFKSPSFVYRQKSHEFHLKKNIRVENLTVNTLNQCTKPFLEFGTCMRRLKLLTAPNCQSQLNYGGFTFRAFCTGISQYLSHIRQFIALVNDRSMLEFSYRISNIIDQVTTLGRICHLNPWAQECQEVLPVGGKLLQYVSTQINTTMRPEIFLLLANILVKCVEFYFGHLEKWIYEGILEDRYQELFIVFSDQYSYDTKRFFDRAYSVREDLIPDFLHGLHEDIVLCGKYTMLLKAHNPFHPLFDIAKPSLKICLSSTLISNLRDTIASYERSAAAACGPRITIEEIHSRKREKVETLKRLVAKSTLENLQKWEIERKEADAVSQKRKQERIQELKNQIESARQDKAEKRKKEIAEELHYLEQNSAFEENQMRRNIEDSAKRIQHYRELNELAEKKIERISKVKIDAKEDVVNENYRRTIEKSNSDIINANESMSGSTNEKNTAQDIENYKNCDNRKLNVNLPENHLTPCQRNKLKVMSHEFNIAVPMDTKLSRAIREETMTELERNRHRILHRDFNSNTEEDGEISRKCLNLNFETERMRNRRKVLESEFDIAIPTKEKLTPMSTTSDYSAGEVSEKGETPEFPVEINEEILTEDVFDTGDDLMETLEELAVDEKEVDVEEVKIEIPEALESNFFLDMEKFKTPAFAHAYDNVVDYSNSDLAELNAVSMKEFLHLSIAIPLECHMSLLNGEIMKMFLDNLDILGHWQSLRSYFLLMDGEFGTHICDGLFEGLEKGLRPGEFLNFHTLHTILDAAISYSAAVKDSNSKRLSFIAGTLPEKFDLLSPNVFESLRLSYHVEWPVNLILNSSTLNQYAAIFQYLLKVRRMGWILESLFQHLKEISRSDVDIRNSPQFQHIHMMRHKFNHFVQTLQNHITVTALETSWRQFMKDLESAQSMMDLYRKHTAYIKRIKFLCMLNRQSGQFLSAIEDVFKLIIHFSRTVVGKSWSKSSSGVTHPRYERLKRIEEDFDKFACHIIQMGWKIVSNGYQTEIGEFISQLNWGEYYSDVVLK